MKDQILNLLRKIDEDIEERNRRMLPKDHYRRSELVSAVYASIEGGEHDPYAFKEHASAIMTDAHLRHAGMTFDWRVAHLCIRAYEKHGFVFHSEVVIWKDPLIAATRTHALGLAHKQIVKDSAMCRAGIPDYLVVMRKPGANPEPVTHKPAGFERWVGESPEPRAERSDNPGKNKYSHEVWQRYASPVWFDINPSDTLQFRSAREDDDQRHICPLQLTVIRRAIELWTNPGDVVFSPFTGIGSEGVVAIEEDRRFIGAELKESYYNQARRNMENAVKSSKSNGLFADTTPGSLSCLDSAPESL